MNEQTAVNLAGTVANALESEDVTAGADIASLAIITLAALMPVDGSSQIWGTVAKLSATIPCLPAASIAVVPPVSIAYSHWWCEGQCSALTWQAQHEPGHAICL
jgi:hypothetical protein